MDDHTKALSALADTAKRTKSAVPHSAPMPVYDFEHLGETLSDSLAQAAEDLSAEAQRISSGLTADAQRLVADAQRLANDARVLAADIRTQVAEQSRILADINSRLKATGEQVLEAHRRFNGS